ncbi:MAG: TolC family protein [Polyangiaceae bacterium]
MNPARRLFAILLTAMSLTGCLSAGYGYERARQTATERIELTSPGLDDSAEVGSTSALLDGPLTADRAARIALARHPEVDAALAEVGGARAALLQALAIDNPRVGAGVRMSPNEPATLELSATLDLARLFTLSLRETSASLRVDAASLDAAGRIVRVAFRARRAFYEYRAAHQDLELAKTIAFATAQSADFTRRMAEAGNVPPRLELLERALFEESRLALTRAEVAESEQREALNRALGLYGEEAALWSIESELEPPDDWATAELEPLAVARNLELAALEKRYSAAQADESVAWAEGLLPSFEVGVSAERTGDTWAAGPSVSLSLPLFYQGQGAVEAAAAEARGVRATQAELAISIRSMARTIATRLEGARAGARFYEQRLLPLRRQIVEATLQSYNAMTATPTEVLEAKRAELEAAREYVSILRDYWVARADAELLLAGQSIGGLDSRPEQ